MEVPSMLEDCENKLESVVAGVAVNKPLASVSIGVVEIVGRSLEAILLELINFLSCSDCSFDFKHTCLLYVHAPNIHVLTRFRVHSKPH